MGAYIMKTYQLTIKEWYGQSIHNYTDYQEYLEKREEAIMLDVLVSVFKFMQRRHSRGFVGIGR